MKDRLFAITIALLAAASLWWVLSQKTRVSHESEPGHGISGVAAPDQTNGSSASSVEADVTTASQDRLSMLPGPVESKPKPFALASVENAPLGPEAGESGSGLTPQTVLENLRSAFRQYHLRFGANPVGDNAEITASLNGQNPRRAVFVDPDDGLRMNDRGELVDNWGTPFFFHQLSRTEMEIYSAGPDRKLWSQDDLVLK
jgi:hypothetical protein